MHSGAGNLEPGAVILDLAADEIDHFHTAMADRCSQWPTGHRPDVLLELRHRGAVERPVPGIVDTRRNLVDEEGAVTQHEHLHRQHADIGEFVRDRLSDPPRLLSGGV